DRDGGEDDGPDGKLHRDFSRAARAVRTAARLALMSGVAMATGVSATCFNVASAAIAGRDFASKYFAIHACAAFTSSRNTASSRASSDTRAASRRNLRFSRRK